MNETVDDSITHLNIPVAIIFVFNIIFGLIVNVYWYFIREPIVKYYEAWWNSPPDEKNKRFEEFRQKEVKDIILSTIIGITFIILNLLLIYFLVYVSRPYNY